MPTSFPLAVLGSPPAFAQPLHVNRPSLVDREGFLARVEDMLDRRWFTNDGPMVNELEHRIAEELGVAHCVLVSNGTTGLMLAVRAAGLEGEVLVPSFTFIATAHALAWAGLRPVFCDIDPETWNLDPTACEAAITARTSAILATHLFGRPCDTTRLAEIARRNDLRLFFDAAHAFGCSHLGRPIGSFGDAEVFSFHATKAFHTFEGGAILTDRDDLAARLRLLRNFGFRDLDDVASLGLNAKMTEISAAMGLANLARFDDLVVASREIYDTYERCLAGTPGLRLRGYSPDERHNWQYVVAEVDRAELGLGRDDLVRVLVAENVLARRYFFPGCHEMEPYVSQEPGAGERLPHTVRAAESVIVLPGGQGMTIPEAERVCEIIQAAAARSEELRVIFGGGCSPELATSVNSVVDSPTPHDGRTRIDYFLCGNPSDAFFSQIAFFRKSLDQLGEQGRAARVVAVFGADEIRPVPQAWEPYFDRIEVAHATRDKFIRNPSFAASDLRFELIDLGADIACICDADTVFLRPLPDEFIAGMRMSPAIAGVVAHYPLPITIDTQEALGPDGLFPGIGSSEAWSRLSRNIVGREIDLPLRHTLPVGGELGSCPFYINYGFLAGPPDLLKELYSELQAVSSAASDAIGNDFYGQAAIALAMERARLPWRALPMRFNFPNDPIASTLYEEELENVILLHYLRTENFDRHEIFARRSAFEDFLVADLSGSDAVFRDYVRGITAGAYPFPATDSDG